MLNACVYIHLNEPWKNHITHLYFFFFRSIKQESWCRIKNYQSFNMSTWRSYLPVLFCCVPVLYVCKEQQKFLMSLFLLLFGPLLCVQSVLSQHGFQGCTCLITRGPTLWWATITTSITSSSSSCLVRATWASDRQGRASISRARVR